MHKISTFVSIRNLIGVSALSVIAGCSQPEVPVLTIEEVVERAGSYDHWDVQGIFKSSAYIPQNVTQPDLIELLVGNTFVAYEEGNGFGPGYGAISITFYVPNGDMLRCIISSKTGRPRDDAFGIKGWASVSMDFTSLGITHPLQKSIEPDGEFGYANVQYNAETGQNAELNGIGGYWVDRRKGHLQEGIPAAVYTACPEFPSAESLGTFVNPLQTSWNYFELVEQDPGERILRPDLVTPFTAVLNNQNVEVE